MLEAIEQFLCGWFGGHSPMSHISDSGIYDECEFCGKELK